MYDVRPDIPICHMLLVPSENPSDILLSQLADPSHRKFLGSYDRNAKGHSEIPGRSSRSPDEPIAPVREGICADLAQLDVTATGSLLGRLNFRRRRSLI